MTPLNKIPKAATGEKIGWAQEFSPLALQNIISPKWRENWEKIWRKCGTTILDKLVPMHRSCFFLLAFVSLFFFFIEVVPCATSYGFFFFFFFFTFFVFIFFFFVYFGVFFFILLFSLICFGFFYFFFFFT